jgi:hypothetical protein
MRRLAAGALITLLLLMVSSIAPAASNEENLEVTRLLADAREKAAVLSKDADEMEALTRSDASWQSHAAMLESIKEHVNDLGRTMERLNEKRDSASEWQKQAIDRAMPLLKELATNTTAAINHLNENKLRPTSGSYTDYLKQNAETAHELSDMISSFVRYGDTRAKLDRLEHKLEIASR